VCFFVWLRVSYVAARLLRFLISMGFTRLNKNAMLIQFYTILTILCSRVSPSAHTHTHTHSGSWSYRCRFGLQPDCVVNSALNEVLTASVRLGLYSSRTGEYSAQQVRDAAFGPACFVFPREVDWKWWKIDSLSRVLRGASNCTEFHSPPPPKKTSALKRSIATTRGVR